MAENTLGLAHCKFLLASHLSAAWTLSDSDKIESD